MFFYTLWEWVIIMQDYEISINTEVLENLSFKKTVKVYFYQNQHQQSEMFLFCDRKCLYLDYYNRMSLEMELTVIKLWSGTKSVPLSIHSQWLVSIYNARWGDQCPSLVSGDISTRQIINKIKNCGIFLLIKSTLASSTNIGSGIYNEKNFCNRNILPFICFLYI